MGTSPYVEPPTCQQHCRYSAKVFVNLFCRSYRWWLRGQFCYRLCIHRSWVWVWSYVRADATLKDFGPHDLVLKLAELQENVLLFRRQANHSQLRSERSVEFELAELVKKVLLLCIYKLDLGSLRYRV